MGNIFPISPVKNINKEQFFFLSYPITMFSHNKNVFSLELLLQLFFYYSTYLVKTYYM